MQISKIIQNPGLICTDSRTIKKDEIFLAVKGKNFDGHDFVRDAFRKGARAAVVSRIPRLPACHKGKLVKVKNTVMAFGAITAIHRLKFDTPVVAVTGSNGKTTVKEMIAHALSAKYGVLKSEKSNNSFLGLPLALAKLDRKHQVCVLEMGMNRAGEIDKLCNIARPSIGVITNIGLAHIGLLGTMKNIFAAKSELLYNLPKGGAAILNKDDAYLSNVKRLKCRRIYFGIDKKCDFRARDLERKKDGWYFSVGKERFQLPLLGRHNIYNALGAIAAARQFGVSFEAIKKRIKTFRQKCPMRLELKEIRGVDILDDSYNSNPMSMERAIEALADCDTEGKRIVVSGDMLELGKQAKTLHESVGKIIAENPVDILVTLGRLSRFTNEAARQGGVRMLYHAASHGDAADFLKEVARTGDVVLVKGSRDMRMEKVIEKFS